MKIIFVTLATPQIEWYSKYTTPFHISYCEKHGYIYELYDKLLDTSRFVTWGKILIVLDALKKHPDCDYVFWCDADCIPLNMDVPLDGYITGEDIIMAQDSNHYEYGKLYPFPFNFTAPCTGNFFIKNTPSAVKYFTKLYYDGRFMHFHFKHNQFHEQSAFTFSLLHESYKNICSIKLLNPYDLFTNELNIYGEIKHFYHAQGQCRPEINKAPLAMLYERHFGKKEE